MRHLIVAVVVGASLFCEMHTAWPDTQVLQPGCFSPPLPTVPVPPVLSRDAAWFSEGVRLDVWRHPCVSGGGLYPLLRVTPLHPSPFVCSSSFKIIQSGTQYSARLATVPSSSSSSFCGDLFVPTTFVLTGWSFEPAFDENAAFTLLFDGGPITHTLEIPAGPPPPPPPTTLAGAAVLPGSRAGQVGNVVTAFASLIASAGPTAVGCKIGVITPISATFTYQQTDPTTNIPIGTPNTPVDIAGGAVKTFVIAFALTGTFAPTTVQLSFDCENTPSAAILPGVNTILLSSSSSPGPDIIAMGATVSGNGIVTIPGTTGTGFFSVATANVGTGASVTATAGTGGSGLPVATTLCQTNSTTGTCLAPPASSVLTQINSGQTSTYAVFVTGNGNVPFNPGINRAVVNFEANGVTVGATSVALQTSVTSFSGSWRVAMPQVSNGCGIPTTTLVDVLVVTQTGSGLTATLSNGALLFSGSVNPNGDFSLFQTNPLGNVVGSCAFQVWYSSLSGNFPGGTVTTTLSRRRVSGFCPTGTDCDNVYTGSITKISSAIQDAAEGVVAAHPSDTAARLLLEAGNW